MLVWILLVFESISSYNMCAARLSAAAAAQSTVYAFSARPLAGGEPVSLDSLRGKVLLIENVASL